MNYMNHYEKIDDLITLLGDFPLPVGQVTREGDTLRYASDVLEVVSVFEKHPSGVTKRSDSVKNVAELNTVCSRIRSISGVEQVRRGKT